MLYTVNKILCNCIIITNMTVTRIIYTAVILHCRLIVLCLEYVTYTFNYIYIAYYLFAKNSCIITAGFSQQNSHSRILTKP